MPLSLDPTHVTAIRRKKQITDDVNAGERMGLQTIMKKTSKYFGSNSGACKTRSCSADKRKARVCTGDLHQFCKYGQ